MKHYRLLLLVVVFGLSVLHVFSTLPAFAAQQPALQVEVQAGFDDEGTYRIGHWFPVTVIAANDGADVPVTIEWRFPSENGVFRYDVDLPRGARKQIDLPVVSVGSSRSAEVQVFQSGTDTLLARQTLRLDPIDTSQIFVGVLSSNLTLLNSLAAAEIAPGLSTAVTHFDPRRFPSDVALLNGFDAIFIHDVATAELGAEQLEALRLWVNLGGRLIVGGGVHAEQTTPGIADLLPVTVGPLRNAVPVTDLEFLARRADLAASLPTLPANSVNLQPDAQTLTGDALISVRDQGSGQVLFAAFDLDALRAWAGEADLWARAVEVEPRVVVGSSIRMDRENLLRSSLNLPAFQIPSTGLLLLLMLVYIVIIGPVNFLILRRIKRVEWAWVTTPLLVVVFLFGSFAVSRVLRGTGAQVTQLAVVQGWEGSDQGLTTAFVGIFSPQRRSYTVDLANDAMVTAATFDSFSTNQIPVQRSDSTSGVTDLLIDVSSLRTLLVEQEVRSVPPISSEIQWTARSANGMLTYQGNQELRSAMIVYRDMAQIVGTLEPGVTVEVDVDGGSNDFPQGIWGIDQSDELFDHSQVLYDLFGYDRFALGGPNYSGTTGFPEEDGVYLVGWSDQVAVDVGLDDTSSVQGQTLYIIRLSE